MRVVFFNQGVARRIRVERRFPAVSSKRGRALPDGANPQNHSKIALRREGPRPIQFVARLMVRCSNPGRDRAHLVPAIVDADGTATPFDRLRVLIAP
jgi:hypothetical protein